MLLDPILQDDDVSLQPRAAAQSTAAAAALLPLLLYAASAGTVQAAGATLNGSRNRSAAEMSLSENRGRMFPPHFNCVLTPGATHLHLCSVQSM